MHGLSGGKGSYSAPGEGGASPQHMSLPTCAFYALLCAGKQHASSRALLTCS